MIVNKVYDQASNPRIVSSFDSRKGAWGWETPYLKLLTLLDSSRNPGDYNDERNV